jgi:hypothetical protein
MRGTRERLQDWRRGAGLAFLAGASLVLTGCPGGGTGGGQDPDPLVEDLGIAYVKRVLPEPGTTEALDVLEFTPGGDLYYRDLAAPGAEERNVTSVVTGGMGDVRDVEVSYDGSKLVFAMRLPDPDPNDDEEPTWNVWEYEIETRNLRRVIASDQTAEAGQDLAPHYLPDGRIVFTSSRQRRSKAVLLDESAPYADANKEQFEALDEDRDNPALVLHVMRDDGSEIQQISFNQSHDLDPMVSVSGDVIFARWDNAGSRDSISFYEMRPDGTELELLYGAESQGTGTNGAQVYLLQPREMPDGRILAVMQPEEAEYPGGDLVLIDVENYVENTQPTLANIGVLTGPAQVPATNRDIRTDGSPSPGGRFSTAFPLWDGTDRMLVSWSLCRLMEGGRIVPCTADRLADPGAEEAPPLYGVYLYDRAGNTQLPVFTPEEGFMYTEVVAAAPRPLPTVLLDKQPGAELDFVLAEEDAGALHIRSVYDFDGVFNPLGNPALTGIDMLADPAQTTADPAGFPALEDRPARFLRIVKAVAIPDDEVVDLDNAAFGRSTQQGMREIIGYAPVQPDGSVKVKVPADVPLAVTLVDAQGQRIGRRHQAWIQVRAGETVTCNGCHIPGNGVSHGRLDAAFASINPGAPTDGGYFPNTDPALFTNYQETMAEVLTRIDDSTLDPSVDIVYEDRWTDVDVRAEDAPFAYRYADLDTAAPATGDCQITWNARCRTIIHYPTHIQPLWDLDRGANTCTICHSSVDAAGAAQTPAGNLQLDLRGVPSGEEPLHFVSYRELLFGDEVLEPVIDPLTGMQAVDPVTGDPLFQTVQIPPAMSVGGAVASGAFFAPFAPGGTHDGFLTSAELKLIREWLDIGAQYYNDPFAVPP